MSNRIRRFEMHDIDRTQMEMEWEAEPFGAGEYEYGEGEYETYLEMYGETYGEAYGEPYGEAGFEGPFDEADEMEMASRLLETTDEGELEQFLGDLFKKVSRTLGRVIPPSVRRSLGGMLKGIAKKYLPVAGTALGNIIAPGVGGAVGGQVASAAGHMFGLELEGLSPEDQEFEVARRYVRMAGEAAQQAAAAPPTASPQAVAQHAIAAAAQKHAPGLAAGTPPAAARPAQPMMGHPRPRTGRWVRRGRVIVVLGV
jgi:hypothetical protein